MNVNLTAEKERALLISVYKDTRLKQECEEHLNELALLLRNLWRRYYSKVPCLVRVYDAATVLSKGKLDEMVLLAKELHIDIVIMDDEIAPSQQRNLEAIFKIPVMDRTELILKVFAARAQTKEAMLQIDLARVRYEAPRLKRLWTHLSRQAGSSGSGSPGRRRVFKREGEKQIEIDRRILKR